MLRTVALLTLSVAMAAAGPLKLNFVQGYSFDPLVDEPRVPAGLSASEPTGSHGYYIIQFAGPVLPEWQRSVERLGAELLWYVPQYAYICRIPIERVEEVRRLPEVRWLGLDQPAYKLFPGLERTDGPQTLIVAFFPAEDGYAQVDQLKVLGAQNVVTEFNPWNKSVKLDVDADAIPAIARLPGVFWVEPYGPMTPDNQNLQWVDQHGYSASDTTRTIWRKGISGRNMIVAVTDLPCWTGHDLFRDPVNNTPGPNHRKIVRYVGTIAAASHGTHTTGTVCGDDDPVGGTSWHDGLAKHARAVFQNYEALPTDWDMNAWFARPDSGLNIAVDSLRALNHSMSLSRKDTFNWYIFADMTADQFIWNHRKFMHCNSMGNYGTNQMGHPVAAKNIISVGGTLNGTSCRSFYTTSSRGPTMDGRRKPQLVSPGQTVYSASHTTANGYVAFSGTSMATPNMTAATALIRQYFRKGFYPTGDTLTGTRIEISAALNKAVAIVGADNDVTGYTVPDNNVGWGRIDLDSSLYFAGDESKLWVLDDTVGLNTGDSVLYTLNVANSTRPLRVSLCWSDYPGTPRAALILVNNLDLTLISPGGTQYRGSVYSGGQSVTGGVYDTLNPEECFRRNAPETGTWTVKVKARNVPFGRQPFALAAIGMFGTTGTPDVGVTAITVPTGTIDSTAAVTPACSVWNYGTATPTYSVRMRIGTSYNQTATVSSHAPGTRRHVTFPAGSAWPRGTNAVTCSTELAGDLTPANDRRTGSVMVNVYNVGTTLIVAPVGTLDSGSTVSPACSVTNTGNATETYDVRLRIGAGYDQTMPVTSHAPGARRYVTFPNWTATARGTNPVSCSTRLGRDMAGLDDRLTGSVTVRVNDVGVCRIVAPAGTVDSGALVTPACSVENFGTATETYPVRMRIGSSYDQTVTVNAHSPGTRQYVTFPQWVAASRGSLAVTCSTRLGTDVNAANDRQTASVDVAVHDIAAVAVLSPAGEVYPIPVAVRARVRNNGTTRAACRVFMSINSAPAYIESVDLAAGLPPADTTVEFPNWTATLGSYTARCSTWLAVDQVPGNNVVFVAVTVAPLPPSQWMSRRQLPAAAKPVKDGGWLGYSAADERVYAARGNKQRDFYAYTVIDDEWTKVADWPDGREAKVPGKGACATPVFDDRLYALKGNNTQGFWCYDVGLDSWRQLSDVPLGTTNKKVKGGSDVVLVNDGGRDYVYCLKGHKNEFWRYDVENDSWQPLAAAPVEKWNKGSWLALGPEPMLYAHQAKYHGFHRFDPAAGTWSAPLTGMPFIGASGRSKKSKDGGSAIWFNDHIYALKGGNTQEFWQYDIGRDSWRERDTMPQVGTSLKKKKVKAGADITIITPTGAPLYVDLPALKGNATDEFWFYRETDLIASSQAPGRSGVQASGVLRDASSVVRIYPNPLRPGFAMVTLAPGHDQDAGHDPNVRRLGSCPKSNKLRIFDAAGRLVLHSSLGTRNSSFALDLHSLSPGVYVLRLGGAAARFVVE